MQVTKDVLKIYRQPDNSVMVIKDFAIMCHGGAEFVMTDKFNLTIKGPTQDCGNEMITVAVASRADLQLDYASIQRSDLTFEPQVLKSSVVMVNLNSTISYDSVCQRSFVRIITVKDTKSSGDLGTGLLSSLQFSLSSDGIFQVIEYT